MLLLQEMIQECCKSGASTELCNRMWCWPRSASPDRGSGRRRDGFETETGSLSLCLLPHNFLHNTEKENARAVHSPAVPPVTAVAPTRSPGGPQMAWGHLQGD